MADDNPFSFTPGEASVTACAQLEPVSNPFNSPVCRALDETDRTRQSVERTASGLEVKEAGTVGPQDHGESTTEASTGTFTSTTGSVVGKLPELFGSQDPRFGPRGISEDLDMSVASVPSSTSTYVADRPISLCDSVRSLDSVNTTGGTFSQKPGRGHWQDNASHCSICGAALGKRRMNPRHHCRLCGRCVCDACSRSCIVMDGEHRLQRACTPCVAIPAFKDRIGRLANNLQCLAFTDTSEAEAPVSHSTLEHAIRHCEAQAAPLNQKLRDVQLRALQAEARAAKLEAELKAAQEANAIARDAGLQISVRLAKVAGIAPDDNGYQASLRDVLEACKRKLAVVEERVELPRRLDEAIAFCESSLQPLRDARAALQPVRQV